MPVPVLIASMMRPEGETGVQTHVRAVRDWLARNGRPVTLVTPFDRPRWQVYPVFGLRRLLDRISKPASVWWYRHWHAVFLQRALSVRLADGKPCVIYAQCPLSARAALRARRSQAQKVVMVVHFNLSQADEWADKGAIPRDGGLFRAIRQQEAVILPQIDALVYVSDFMRRELQSRIAGLVAVPSRVIPNFLGDPGAVQTIEAETDLITVGTLEARKNQRYALEIVQAAAQLGRPLSLTVAGDGPDRAMLEHYVKDKGLGAQVRFLGFVPHAAALMPGHRACLHVARMENLPLTLIEALSRGLPVFAPQAGGMPEVFNDAVEGRLIPLDDAPAAARLIIEWLDDERRMRLASDAARQRFLERFEADRVAAELAVFLEAVAA
ncbi:MAG: glycosyltransferase family 4 protein [Thiobacillus sp.]|uniref:glycosyltransferase family 4 protein n=1 Tax=Thiobacillus sp. TaxID=924 RepID=UPI0027342486|nr:glycosyltransferase family 4 protein [Thiobacillus sp.]MDP3584436.1 glycosyltransferase family 4 protein [Thiobacillus sp.]